MNSKGKSEMVVGSGAIANRFLDYALQSRYLLFAGNVHNSAIDDEQQIAAEENTVKHALANHADVIFVYFSSCSVVECPTSPTPYQAHKLRMEHLVKGTATQFLILRIPQLMALADEANSLLPFLVSAVSESRHFDVWKNATRNLIDIDDVYRIVHTMLSNECALNRVVNVASSQQTRVLDLVQIIERYLGKAASYRLVEKGDANEIDSSDIAHISTALEIDFGQNYVPNAIDKYYRHLVKPPWLLSIIVPTYNEEAGINEFYRRTKAVLESVKPRFQYELIFVNDYSQDQTYSKLVTLAAIDPNVKLINFSRNFGNQIAITAGIDFARGDIAIIIDDDLQDPPEIMLNFLMKWSDGYKVVYGVRPKRDGVNWLFKVVAKGYYRLVTALSDTQIPNDTGDFRLIDRVVIDKLRLMREESRYYRGMVAWVGFKQVGWTYQRDSRYAGTSTFSFRKYVNFALTGLTSFSEKPLYLSSLLGFFITALGFSLCCYLVLYKIFNPSVSLRGWTSLIAVIIFFGGVQLLSIGIIGVYISKIFREVKGRPLYVVDGTINVDTEDIVRVMDHPR